MFNLLGSLGLFLLGMWLMTEGLKLAGGHALEHLLGRWTSSRKRALMSGIGITALVQSSSAVTLAIIGFVNAGLISFQQALWVVFGSNVGTTFTAWIVTLFGFSFKIDAFAFPLVGIGALLRIFAPQDRGKALGMALAGFGLLFLGIDALKTNFEAIAHQWDIAAILAAAGIPTLAAMLVGIGLTILTQSSSAAIAIILTAVASGVLGMEVAAAAVIGANVGTTSTALLAAVGATANAKRLAWAHVVFNLFTGAVALLFLPFFWWLVTHLSTITGLGHAPTVLLAVFHTCFNLLGLLLIWPLEARLSRYLLARFQPHHDQHISRHLDDNVASIPDLAVRALTLELMEIFATVRHQFCCSNIELPRHIKALQDRLNQVQLFVGKALQSELASSQSALLAAGFSAAHHLNYATLALSNIQEQRQFMQTNKLQAPAVLTRWQAQLREWLQRSGQLSEENARTDFEQIKVSYASLKSELINAAANALQPIGLTDTALTEASFSRRFAEQLLQVDEALQQLQANLKDVSSDKLQPEAATHG